MRKVLFKRWIPKEIIKNPDFAYARPKEGTNCWELDFTHEGIFHQWGSTYEELEAGPGNYSVALIELSDGSIEQVLPTNIKFIN